MSLVRYLTHRLVLLSLLVSLGIAGLLARNLWVVHENALASAELASRNLSHTLAVGLQWVLAEVDHDILQVRNVLQHRDQKTWECTPCWPCRAASCWCWMNTAMACATWFQAKARSRWGSAIFFKPCGRPPRPAWRRSPLAAPRHFWKWPPGSAHCAGLVWQEWPFCRGGGGQFADCTAGAMAVRNGDGRGQCRQYHSP